MQANNNNYLSSAKNQKIQFTIMEGENVGKSYHVDDNNTLVKSTQGNFFKGTFRTFKGDHQELNNFIKSQWAPNMFIVQGLNHLEEEAGQLPDDAQRTKEHFPFQDYPGLLIIDSDSVNDYGINTMEELKEALINIEPALRDVSMYMSPSASSNIYLDGQPVNGLRGVHTFIPIKSTIDNKRILETLHKKSIINGYVNVGISKAGTPLIRSLIDTAIKSPNQPCFSSRATLNDDRLSQDVICMSWNIDNDILDPHDIKDLYIQDEIKVNNKIKKLHDEKLKTPECKKIRKEWEEKRTLEMQKQNPSMSLEEIKATLTATKKNQLYIDYPIVLEGGEKITVKDILSNPKKYHGVECLEPLEHDHHAGAIIYSDQEKPCIKTFAHGGTTYFLRSVEMSPAEVARIELEERIDEFNQRHAKVLVGGESLILRESLNDSSFELFTFETMRKNHSSDFVYERDDTGKIIKRNKFIEVWLSHPDHRKYQEGFVMDPDNDYSYESGIYNSWKGLDVEPREHKDPDTLEGLKLIDYHIKQILCAGDVALYDYVIKWIAWGFQNPGKQIGTAIVAIGGQGIGKSLFGEFLKDIWGKHGVLIDQGEMLTGRFNSTLEGACFALCEEAFFHGDKKQINSLKAKITSSTLRIERKGLEPYEIKNTLKVFMCSNEQHAVSAGVDERRYCVLNVSGRHKGDIDYFKRLVAVLRDKKVREEFLHRMMTIKLDDYVVGIVPETTGLKRQRLESLDSVGKFLVDGLDVGGFNIGGVTKWREKVKPNELYGAYELYCRANNVSVYDKKTINKFGRIVKEIYPCRRVGNDRCYVFGEYHNAVALLEHHFKIDLTVDGVSVGDEHKHDALGDSFVESLVEEVEDDTKHHQNPSKYFEEAKHALDMRGDTTDSHLVFDDKFKDWLAGWKEGDRWKTLDFSKIKA